MHRCALSWNSALGGGGWSTPRPGRFIPSKRPITCFIGGWVGPRTGLDGCGKYLSSLGFDPPTVQLVACRYTNWDIVAYLTNVGSMFYRYMISRQLTWGRGVTSRKTWIFVYLNVVTEGFRLGKGQKGLISTGQPSTVFCSLVYNNKRLVL
jgi:hypothetical protein